jgi:hypothetical protein
MQNTSLIYMHHVLLLVFCTVVIRRTDTFDHPVLEMVEASTVLTEDKTLIHDTVSLSTNYVSSGVCKAFL